MTVPSQQKKKINLLGRDIYMLYPEYTAARARIHVIFRLVLYVRRCTPRFIHNIFPRSLHFLFSIFLFYDFGFVSKSGGANLNRVLTN